MTYSAPARLRAPLLVLTVLAALVVTASGFAAPGSPLPPLAIVLGAAAALGLAALALGPLGWPQGALLLAPGTLLVAALLGIGAVLATGGGTTPASMGVLELTARCVALALALVVLAVLCPFPIPARVLAGVALGGPILLVLNWTLAAVLPGLEGGAVGLTVAGLVLLALALLAAWGAYLRRSRVLELVQQSLGRRAVHRALTLETPEQREEALALLDGWLDPLGIANERARGLATAAAGEPRRLALEELMAVVTPHGGSLPLAARETLLVIAGVVPEAHTALAADELARSRPEQARERLATLERAVLTGKLVRVAQPLDPLLAARAADPVLVAQRERLDEASIAAEFAAAHDRPQALQQAFLVLQERGRPLNNDVRATLAELLNSRPETAILLAEDDMRRGQPADALVSIGAALLAPSAGVEWLTAEGFRAWERHGAWATADVQRVLWQRIHNGPSGSALVAQALTALELGLATDVRAILDASSGDDAALLAALDELHHQRVAPRLTSLLARADLIPPAVVEQRVLPRLRMVAGPADSTLFFRRDARPQLLEIIEAPPTSIYGGRVSVWKMERGGRAVRLAVTGSGPAPVAARVATILGDLASERGCASDVLLAGAAFFDLTDRTAAPARTWSQEDLERRVLAHAERLGVQQDVRAALGETSGRELLAVLMAQPSHTTVESALEALDQAGDATGFVEVRHIDAAAHDDARVALSYGATAPASSLPVLVPYRAGLEPLQVRLPAIVAGLAGLDAVVDEFRIAVLAEIRAEWERRRRLYLGWAERSAKEYKDLREELKRDGAQTLAARSLQFDTRIDLDSLEEIAVDPPELTTALEQLERLPDLLVRELVFLARAEERLEMMPMPEGFAPHWTLSTVVDACIRGCALPIESPHLRRVRTAWEADWRPTVLLAIQQALAEHGATLRDVAVENSVLRVVSRDAAGLQLEFLHIFDPHYDIAPPATAPVTRFQPRWGSRHRTFMPAAEAQSAASEIVGRALQNRSLPAGTLRALAWDSGAALDALLALVAGPLESPNLERDMAQAVRLVATRQDPFVTFFEARRAEPPLVQAQQAGEEGRVVGALPDLLAFELYKVGQVVHAWAKAEMGAGSDSDGTRALAAMGPWEIVREVVRDGPHAYAVRQALEATPLNRLPQPGSGVALRLDAGRVKETAQLLKRRNPDYAARTLAGLGFPLSSRLRKRRSGPGALHSHLRAAYYIAEGDAALAIARVTLADVPACREQLDMVVERLKSIAIPATLARPVARRDTLVTQLDALRNTPDRANLTIAADALRQARLDALQYAEAAYRQASLTDTKSGDAWLRLARLKWLIGSYREALWLLVGPRPAPRASACQLPLAVAVGAVGGELNIELGDLPWNGVQGLQAEAAADDGVAALAFLYAGGLVGSCTVEGLSAVDAQLLADLFGRHRPEQLNDRPAESFEEWLRLTPVPGLGLRGELAQAVAGEQGFVLLAAMVYLGVAGPLAPDTEPPPRPAAWLATPVVRQVAWLTQTARTA